MLKNPLSENWQTRKWSICTKFQALSWMIINSSTKDGPCDMLKNALRDIANWRTKRPSSHTKSQILAWMIIITRKSNSNPLEKLSKVWSQIVLKCLYLARIGGPHILWSMNKLARSVTKWTGACDRRSARLISYLGRDLMYFLEVKHSFPLVGCARNER